MTLPNGYDTPVGELGDTLIRRRAPTLGLARAFLHDAPFMLLDEPTSNLDSLNEAIILKISARKRADKTVVLVSHRQSTMRIADTDLFGGAREDELMSEVRPTKREREKRDGIRDDSPVLPQKPPHSQADCVAECAALDSLCHGRGVEQVPVYGDQDLLLQLLSVHCYKPDMREKIREIMRFSGPRMIFHHPMTAITHVIETKKEKKRLEESR